MKIKRKINNKIVAAKKRAAAIKAADDPRTWAHNNPIKKDRGNYYEYIYTVDPNKLYYGCPGAYFISMGNNVEDPWIEWEGWLYNATDLEDALYNDFGEWLTQSTEAEAQTFDGGFEDWVTPYLVENVLYDLNPFAKVVYDKGNNHTARGVSPTEWFNDNMNIDEITSDINSKGVESSMKIRRNRVTANKRRAVRAAYEERRSFDAYGYDENGDIAYEGLPYALDSIDEVTAWLKAMLDGVEEFKSQWSEWGGDTSELEMFSGPDDAENFGADMYSDIIQNGLEPIANKLGDMLNVYIYP